MQQRNMNVLAVDPRNKLPFESTANRNVNPGPRWDSWESALSCQCSRTKCWLKMVNFGGYSFVFSVPGFLALGARVWNMVSRGDGILDPRTCCS